MFKGVCVGMLAQAESRCIFTAKDLHYPDQMAVSRTGDDLPDNY